ncbi:Odorant receptor 49b [Habropoda laboriosa]|uniref:Odorant receptor n=1 Tax=Habropoda laboriosa TaxID=597456 RepID=A0A0L7RAI2_9HYME|nr:Odorant receptor 49b [Habropoda laboriosa]
MSLFNANIHRVLHILELAGRFTCTWPLDSNSSKREVVFRNVRWGFTILNVILLLISLILAIFHFRNDITILMKTISEMTALLEVLMDMILCKMKSAQLQVLVGKVKAFVKVANKNEIKIIQGYVDRYKRFFGTIAMGYVMTGITFSLAPLFSVQELPADGWIPFSIKPLGVYCLVYFVQVYCILQTAFCISVDFMIALLISFSAAKLDILGMKLRKANGHDVLVSCVKEHQEIIGFVEDIKTSVETLLFKTNATMGSAVICGTFPLIYNQSLTVISQFLPLMLSGCGRLYVISWPADDLKESSITFAKSLIDSPWIGKPRKMTNIVIIMMQRSQRILLITMGGILPAISLEYYANFLTTVGSYFMAMRTMIES